VSCTPLKWIDIETHHLEVLPAGDAGQRLLQPFLSNKKTHTKHPDTTPHTQHIPAPLPALPLFGTSFHASWG